MSWRISSILRDDRKDPMIGILLILLLQEMVVSIVSIVVLVMLPKKSRGSSRATAGGAIRAGASGSRMMM